MATFEKRAGGWRAKVRRKGYPSQSATFDTLADARAWARELERRIDRGELGILDREARELTLGQALARYAAEITPAKRGAPQELVRIAAWRAHELAARPLASVRTADLARHRDARLAAGRSPSTVRLELAVLSHLYAVARSEWGMEGLANPAEALRKPGTASRRRDRRLRPGEELALRRAAPELAPWLEPLLRLALATAMRRGELASLDWSQVDIARRVAALDTTKNGDARDVPLLPEAVRALWDLAHPDGLACELGPPAPAWPSSGRVVPASADLISHRWIELRDRAGCAGLRFHDLRHEAGSRLLELGLSVREVMAWGGWRTISAFAGYTHPRAEDMARKAAG